MFETGQQVLIKDPVWFDEEIAGFVAKQLDEHHFLVKLDHPFLRTNPRTPWLKCDRQFAHQTVRPAGSDWWTQLTAEEVAAIADEHGILQAHLANQTGTDRLVRGQDDLGNFWLGMWYDGESLYDVKWSEEPVPEVEEGK